MWRVQSGRRGINAPAMMAVAVLLGSCSWEAAERAATRTEHALARADAARIAKYPTCTNDQKPRMITFNQTIDPVQMITVAGVGDVLLHDSMQRYAALRAGGFSNLFAPVADLIQAADVSFANLEGPTAEGITKTGRKVKATARRFDGWVYSGYPMFNYHPSVATDLKKAGFDVLLAANNHALDRYAVGADKTIDVMTAAGVAFTGIRKKGDTKSPWHAITPVTQRNRTWNIAWLGCAYATNGIPDRHKQVLHCYDQRAEVLKIIGELAKRKDVHAIIFVPHWGQEYWNKPDGNQKLLARQVLDAGATAVIGSHPHVIQPFEKYITKDKRETLIAYSLGKLRQQPDWSGPARLGHSAARAETRARQAGPGRRRLGADLDAQRRRADSGGSHRPGQAPGLAPPAPAADPAGRQPASAEDALLVANGLPDATQGDQHLRPAQP